MRVRRRPEELFDLVADVRAYPRFVPFIAAMRVMEESEGAEGVSTMVAETAVGYGFVRERFTTRVLLNRPALRIDVSYLSGPFEALANHWQFERLPDGSTLMDFRVEYAFRNPVLKLAFESAKGRAAHMIMDAFANEAVRRYPEDIGDVEES